MTPTRTLQTAAMAAASHGSSFRLSATSGVIGNLLACPRIPSVPKYFRAIVLKFPATLLSLDTVLPQYDIRRASHCVIPCYERLVLIDFERP
jgi:hypothetical protein